MTGRTIDAAFNADNLKFVKGEIYKNGWYFARPTGYSIDNLKKVLSVEEYKQEHLKGFIKSI